MRNSPPGGGGRQQEVVTVPSSQPRAEVYRLHVLDDDGVITRDLPVAGSVTIGRSEDADLVIAEPWISRRHAQIVLRPGEPIRIHDCGSSNGTRVRGTPLAPQEPVEVAVGDPIELGSTLMLIRADRLRRASATPAAEPSPRALPDAMTRLHELVARVSSSTINVLLLGETGAGKEVTARAIHEQSARRDGPFIGINCASFNHTLFESELFGYEKGAFTGANRAKQGTIEAAHGGTLFLDEVGETPLDSQAKLLRVLELRQVVRLGSLQPRDVDVRVIAATNRDLSEEIAAGRFREDLYYRLNGISLTIPPLRERPDEIIPLAEHFGERESAALGYPHAAPLSAQARRVLEAHPWPGNVRELKNVIQRAVLLSGGRAIEPEHLRLDRGRWPAPGKAAAVEPASGPANVTSANATLPSLPLPGAGASASASMGSGAGVGAGADAGAGMGMDGRMDASTGEGAPVDERQRIIDALAACGGNQTRAAKRLGISRRTLTTRLNQFDIPRPRKNRKPRDR
ncbi:MAG: sigma 54-interacting transcriptional regulator [Myxococcales bacterium]|nr:sigma 54-interacting transcriptional regulator [Myxococcales bacterium]